jgi:hypothetical protein
MMALPPVPEVTVMVPLPLVGDGDTEYVALNAAPETGPLGAPMSSAPVILPVGVAPSAVNSPEKTTTPKSIGLVAKPAYVPFSVLLVNEPADWGSPIPNKTLTSETKRKI